MKLFTASQIHELDAATIERQGITSLQLMERAAQAITDEITIRWDNTTPIVAFAGPGNNGGDALVVSRQLADKGYSVRTYLFNVKGHLSPDCQANMERLNEAYPDVLVEVTKEFSTEDIPASALIVDGLFGSGINKPLTGGFAAVVKFINQTDATVVSIDIPSGLMTEDNTYNVRTNIIQADYTFTLGQRKLCMLMADMQQYLGEVHVLDIGLDVDYIMQANTQCETLDETTVLSLLKRRSAFAHKGTMGHALLIAGSRGMAGAAILSARACLRSGVGKLTVHTPQANADIMQISVPEAVLSMDHDPDAFNTPVPAHRYNAIGMGPGLGTGESTGAALLTQLRSSSLPMVLDADALNLLAAHPAWMLQLPDNLILTPHPREMDRLLDTPAANDYDRLLKASDLAQNLKAYIILKGHYSALCLPNGNVVFNTTGNAGMATAGSGDVLTGIITGLLARGYSSHDAALVGMYIHGLAGDLAANELGQESLIASDIVAYLPKAFSILGF